MFDELVCIGDTTGRPLKPVYRLMGDPRNVAHAKKVTQEKQHKAKACSNDSCAPARQESANRGKRNRLQLGKALRQSRKPKSRRNHQIQAQLEKSLAVLSNLKDLEFHSRANIEKLAELSLTIEEELKQKAFAEAIGAVYGAQDAFQSKILELIGAYEAECTRLSWLTA